MKLCVIVAVAQNGVIGSGGRLPWHLPADLQRFRTLTLGHPVIMGRRTFESLGKPLSGRRNLVISSRAGWRAAGAEVFPSLDAALARCPGEDLVYVIGGASLYHEALPRADRLYLTRVEAEIPGDVTFPSLDLSTWRLVEEEQHPADDRNRFPMRFQTFERNNPT